MQDLVSEMARPPGHGQWGNDGHAARSLCGGMTWQSANAMSGTSSSSSAKASQQTHRQFLSHIHEHPCPLDHYTEEMRLNDR